jgi:hypothetical protein
VESPPFFVEDFNSGLPSPNLLGYENFTLDDGAIRSNGLISDDNDRRYMRTAISDYNARDFRYDLTFTTNTDGIHFIGIGSGNRRPGVQFGHNEPWESLFFRVHAPNAAGGYVSVANHPASDVVVLGNLPTAGTHRSRIEKVGSAITFSIDRNYQGVFVADMSHTFPDIAAVAPFLNNSNSRLFFGTVYAIDSFDDMSVVPEPGGIMSLGVAAIALLLCRTTLRFRDNVLAVHLVPSYSSRNADDSQ